MKDIESHDAEDPSGSSDGSHSVASLSHSYFSSNQHTNADQSDEVDNKEKIRAGLSKHGTAAIFRLRMILLVVMILTAAAVSIIVHRITSYDEQKGFILQYGKAAEKVLESLSGVFHKITSINSVGVAATAFGLDHSDEKWPFHTMTSFQQQASTARLVSGALYISVNPVVTDIKRDAWEEYSARDSDQWINDGLSFHEKMGWDAFIRNLNDTNTNTVSRKNESKIVYFNNQTELAMEKGPGPYLPSWISSPYLPEEPINENLFRNEAVGRFAKECIDEHQVIFGSFEYGPPGPIGHPNSTTSFFATLRSVKEGRQVSYLGDPMSRLYIPVLDSFEENRTVVAVMMAVIHWRSYLRRILPTSVDGITVVLENSCGGAFTYEIHGPEASLVGFGDLHDPAFDDYACSTTYEDIHFLGNETGNPLEVNVLGCLYRTHVYPTQIFYDSTQTKTPFRITLAISMVFLVTIATFLLYDRLVERRQLIVLEKAAQSTAIVTSLFPKQVCERLLEDDDLKEERKSLGHAPKNKLKNFLSSPNEVQHSNKSTMAELFPNCTVLFADISGFTAWSSTREPELVFVLLQTVFIGFDKIAKRRKVFKVETIGDCYVAVTGLPESQSTHALIMARFAWECKHKMHQMTRELEVTLGPDCSDLVMRFGLHSGPVTAGVLRGDRARFQLFGDTVNTASRMESNGVRDKIQVSQATADLLIHSGKDHWIEPREDIVDAKGKGLMQTYWLNLGSRRSNTRSVTNSATEESGQSFDDSNDGLKPEDLVKLDRLVDWMVELLLERLKKVLYNREKRESSDANPQRMYEPKSGAICLDEVQEIINMSEFTGSVEILTPEILETVEVDQDVHDELREYVSMIARMYRNNPFHCFDHACHVVMSVNKLLKRIVSPELDEDDHDDERSMDAWLYKYTYGLCSDHLARFAIVFSALIHDVDHRGCSNARLIDEEVSMGEKYRNKSVAEQNSVDIAWNLLMDDRFQHLRRAMFESNEELLRFRQFVVNTVLATDIFDKELNELRKKRWLKAFSNDDETESSDAEKRNTKATIVIEHIIQASDVCHTMQHWHVYRKWNKLLFKEMYCAYQSGRMKANPADFWYQGELQFFDNYIIPLANKLKECNVFGVSSDEYLNYAEGNRAEWARRGNEIVSELINEMASQNLDGR